MAIGKSRAHLRSFRTLLHLGAVGEWNDGQLLERFLTTEGDPSQLAFTTLVERHGPLVDSVCRAVLNDPDDAQDAFQATFLVLVRKARGLWVRESLGPWLYQVAQRTALAARAASARRRRHERRAGGLAPVRSFKEGDDGSRRALHEELQRLPERYRAPILLCDLESRTHSEAARALGVPVGTVKSRLSRGRDRLRARLRRRGFAPESSPLVAPWVGNPPTLETRFVVSLSSAHAMTEGPAFDLTYGVLRSMKLAGWSKVVAAVLLAAVTTTGLASLRGQTPSEEEPKARDAKAPGGKPAPAEAVVVKAERGKMDGKVADRGSITTVHTASLVNKIQGRTTILTIRPDRSLVKKGDLVAELDASTLRDNLGNAVISLNASRERVEDARAGRRMADNELDFYRTSRFPRERQVLLNAIRTSEDVVKIKQESRNRADKALNLFKKAILDAGRPTTIDSIVGEVDLQDRIDDAELAIRRESLALETARANLKSLDAFERTQAQLRLEKDVKEARAEELNSLSAYDLAKTVEAKLRRQIEACKVYAPIDGMLAYAPNAPSGAPRIEEGATVVERQLIGEIRDVDGPVRFEGDLSPALADRVKPGMEVQVEVDAFRGRTFPGKVARIDPWPRPDRRGRRVRRVEITLEPRPTGVTEGMTALFETLLTGLADAISIPTSSIQFLPETSADVPRGEPFVALKRKGGQFVWMSVKLGIRHGDRVEIREGLAPGDEVAIDPRAAIPAPPPQKPWPE